MRKLLEPLLHSPLHVALYLVMLWFAFVLIIWLTGCAVTRVEYGPDGKITQIAHKRFIIDEEFKVITRDWSAECRSQPDPESIALIKSGIELGKAMAATAAKP